MVNEYPLLRVAADLAAAATAVTPWVPCRGASMVSFHIRATSADVPGAAYVIEVRKRGDMGRADSSANIPATVIGTSAPTLATPGALNTIGNVCYFTGVAPTGAPVIVTADEARITVTGHATNIITGLSIAAQVVYGTDPGVNLIPTPTS